jgi:hypothetical protein
MEKLKNIKDFKDIRTYCVNKKINEIKIMNNELKQERKCLNISELEEIHNEFRKNVEEIRNLLENVSVATEENMYNSVVDDVYNILEGNERWNVLNTLKKIYNSFLRRKKMSEFLIYEESMLIYFNQFLEYKYTNDRVDSKLCKDNLKLCEEQLNDLKKSV